MGDSDGPFVGWNLEDKARLVEKCGDIQQRATMFCFSTMLRRSEYLEHYRNEPQPCKVQLDTMYGLCFRFCVIQVTDLLKKTFKGKPITLNFIVEEGAKNLGQARKIFAELKREDTFKDVLCVMIAGGKKAFPGLQGADFVSHTTFLAEQEGPKLEDFPADGNVYDARNIFRQRSPAFRNHIDPDLLKDWKQRMLEIDAKRIAFGQRKAQGNPPVLPADATE